MFNDLLSIFKVLLKQKNKKRLFFVENNYTFQHIAPFIERSKKKEKIIIITLIDLKDFDQLKKIDVHFFKNYFFLNLIFYILKVKFIYSTTPGLGFNAFQRSIFKNYYIYLQHSSISLIEPYSKNAFNNFDYVQVNNTFQLNDLKFLNKINNLNIKALKIPYFFFEKKNKVNDLEKKKILIAPTWGTDFYDEIIFGKVIEILGPKNFILRPHPLSFKDEKFLLIKKKYDLIYDKDLFIKFEKYSNLISDWSGIFIEFAIINKKKPIVINTTPKINSNIRIDIPEKIEKFCRGKIAKEINIQDIALVKHYLEEVDLSKKGDEISINNFFKKYFF